MYKMYQDMPYYLYGRTATTQQSHGYSSYQTHNWANTKTKEYPTQQSINQSIPTRLHNMRGLAQLLNDLPPSNLERLTIL